MFFVNGPTFLFDFSFFFFNDTATTEIYTLSLHDALPISRRRTAAIRRQRLARAAHAAGDHADAPRRGPQRSERRQRRARRPPPRRQRPSDRPHRSPAPAQPRRPAVLRPRTRRRLAHRRGGHRNAPPPRRRTRRHLETSGEVTP